MFKDKWFIIGILATVFLVVGGVFLMSQETPATPISSDILVPKTNYGTGSSSSKITLVEFGDYECPACVIYNPLVKQLLTDFPGNINYIFRNFPLAQHKNAFIASQAVEAAGLQGKYWQMHDKMYESVSEWSEASDAESIFIEYAKVLEIDIEKFKVDINSSAIKNKIQDDIKDGNLVGIRETPTFYLNGLKINDLTGNYEDFKKIISDQL